MRVPVVRLHKETARVCTCTGRGEREREGSEGVV